MLAAAIASMLLTGCTAGPQPDPSPPGIPTEIGDALDGLTQRFVGETGTPGLLVGVWTKDGEYVRALGTADLLTGAPIARDQQYRIGSQTKVMVGSIILQLAGEGALSLDDPVSTWVDGVPGGDGIAIRQLLNHTSGLGDIFASPTIQAKLADGCTPEELLTEGAQVPVIGPPGGQWHYSNYAWDLLGWIAQEASGGTPLSTLIQERIAEPLGLTRTSLTSDIAVSGLTEPAMHGYMTTDDLSATPDAAADASSLPSSCLWAAGGAVSTLDDMHTWVDAMATGQLVDPEVWAEATAEPVTTPDIAMGPNDFLWYLGPAGFGSFIGHQGGLPGYESASFSSPETGTTIVVASNKQYGSVAITGFVEELALAVDGPDAAPIQPGEGFTKLTSIP